MDAIKRYAFASGFLTMQEEVHRTSVEKWGEENRNDGEALALIHSEVSEGLEALREGKPVSEKIEGFLQIEEELADVVIRVMDFAARRDLNVAEAILAKAEYNKTRFIRHGGKLF